jgi:hypothetical protein
MTVETPLVNGKNPFVDWISLEGLTFNKVVPCPKLVKHTSESSDYNKYTKKAKREYVYSPDGQDKPGSRVLNHRQVQYLREQYGAVDWYSWNVEHWGTKWDIDPIRPEYSGSEAVLDFETAWSPPEAVAKALSEMFGGCEVTLDFFEPGCDFGGRVVYRNGECVEDQHLTARASRDISDWHDHMYGPGDDEEEEEAE